MVYQEKRGAIVGNGILADAWWIVRLSELLKVQNHTRMLEMQQGACRPSFAAQRQLLRGLSRKHP